MRKLENLNSRKIKYLLGFSCIALLLLTSCENSSPLKQSFSCKESFFSNLEVIKDVKNNFTVAFPASWKTKLYTDQLQSSIYSADTIKQLTNSILLDISVIETGIKINDIFKLKIEQENLNNKLIQKEAKEILLLEKPSYYVVSKGFKGKYKYQALQIFTQINTEKSLIAKAEIYGDSLVEQRFCKAITLIEKIKILP